MMCCILRYFQELCFNSLSLTAITSAFLPHHLHFQSLHSIRLFRSWGSLDSLDARGRSSPHFVHVALSSFPPFLHHRHHAITSGSGLAAELRFGTAIKHVTLSLLRETPPLD